MKLTPPVGGTRPEVTSPRCGSPLVGCSILITSAPQSASTAPAAGTNHHCATSRTRTPCRTPLIGGSLPRLAGGLPVLARARATARSRATRAGPRRSRSHPARPARARRSRDGKAARARPRTRPARSRRRDTRRASRRVYGMWSERVRAAVRVAVDEADAVAHRLFPLPETADLGCGNGRVEGLDAVVHQERQHDGEAEPQDDLLRQHALPPLAGRRQAACQPRSTPRLQRTRGLGGEPSAGSRSP